MKTAVNRKPSGPEILRYEDYPELPATGANDTRHAIASIARLKVL